MGTQTIECSCGAVKLELEGAPLAQLYCHCRDCQAVHGAAYTGAAMFPRAAIRLVQGEPTRWALRRTTRWTCPQCGTRILAEGTPQAWGIVATLLPPERFRPTAHIHCASARLPVRDELPHYADLPAAFGGSDQRVEW